MKRYICVARGHNKVSTYLLSRVQENESLKDFKKRTRYVFPLEEGWRLEYSEWNKL